MSKINNITDLRDDLLHVYESVKDGKTELAQAKELANIAGKVIKTANIQLDYNKHVGVKTPIPFISDKTTK